MPRRYNPRQKTMEVFTTAADDTAPVTNESYYYKHWLVQDLVMTSVEWNAMSYNHLTTIACWGEGGGGGGLAAYDRKVRSIVDRKPEKE